MNDLHVVYDDDYVDDFNNVLNVFQWLCVFVWFDYMFDPVGVLTILCWKTVCVRISIHGYVDVFMTFD